MEKDIKLTSDEETSKTKKTKNLKGREELERLYDESIKDVKEGQIVKGKIVAITNKDVLIDIGYKSEGAVSINEFDDPGKMNVGDQIQVMLESKEDENGVVVLSKEKAEKTLGWEKIISDFHEGDSIEGKIVSRIKGGFMVNIGMDAFLPASLASVKEVGGPNNLMGMKMMFKIVKISKPRKNVVLSRKDFLYHEKEETKKKLLGTLNKNAKVKGMVKNITDFGAFVDIGGIIGLLHITDMSWARISHPSQVVKIGQEIEVVILDFDKEKLKVSLGLKQITDDPWKDIDKKYSAGQKIKGKIVNIVPYGAFIELEKGIEGLVHISELSWSKKYEHPEELLKEQDSVDIVILDIDKESKKISLGIKQLTDDPWLGIEKSYNVGDKLKGKISSITDYGAFVELKDGIDGLVHVSDISWTKKITSPKDYFKKGQELEIIVLSVDEKNRRISLGIKQLEPDPWDEIAAKFSPGTVTKGKITNITNFGIFIEIDKDLEGLLHISEAGIAPSEKLENKFKVGDEIEVSIIRVDGVQKKIALSRKPVATEEKKEENKK